LNIYTEMSSENARYKYDGLTLKHENDRPEFEYLYKSIICRLELPVTYYLSAS